jgi:hypothetical protein
MFLDPAPNFSLCVLLSSVKNTNLLCHNQTEERRKGRKEERRAKIRRKKRKE